MKDMPMSYEDFEKKERAREKKEAEDPKHLKEGLVIKKPLREERCVTTR